MFRSATFKLTMWYLALVVAISIAFSVVLYHVATAELASGLHRETQRIYNQFPIFDNSPMLKPDTYDQEGAHRILLRLIAFNSVVIVIAGFASYWLARRTLKPIEDAHEQQKRFTADVSHELRTPLTALKMESEVALMNKQADNAELRHTLESNLEEAGKLETLINNLLRLSRLEANELQHGFVTVNSGELVTKALQQVQKLADEHKITLQSTTVDTELMGDEDSLVQLLVILLDNALKYSPHGSKVEIKSRVVIDRVVISIKDEGIGIEPANLERVFDRFYRANNSRSKTDADGFGLGLSIAKMIADVHNGDIVLSSRVGKGTTATISLPKVMQQIPESSI